MDPFQLFACAVSLAHACLLAGVFFASSVYSRAYVSTEIHALLAFRVGLTLIVLAEAALSAAYICMQGGSQARVASGVGWIAAALAGWSLVASFDTTHTEHLAGAVVFIAATAVYSYYFIQRSAALRAWLYALWGATIALAVAFAALYFTADYENAARLEWAAFSLDAITLFLFFAENPPAEAAARQGRSRPTLREREREWEMWEGGYATPLLLDDPILAWQPSA